MGEGKGGGEVEKGCRGEGSRREREENAGGKE